MLKAKGRPFFDQRRPYHPDQSHWTKKWHGRIENEAITHLYICVGSLNAFSTPFIKKKKNKYPT